MALIKITVEQAGQEYLAYHTAKGSRPNTLRTIEVVMHQLQAAAGDIQVQNITGQHVEKMFTGHDWSQGTRNLKRAILNVFFAWCRNRRYMQVGSDPLFGWRHRPVAQAKRLRIPPQDWARLLDAADFPVTRAYLAVSLYTFVRVSEAQTLRVDDVDLDRQEVHIVRHKTSSRDTLPMSLELERELRTYLAWYSGQLAAQGLGALRGDHYLLPPRTAGAGARHALTHQYVGGADGINPRKPCASFTYQLRLALERSGIGFDPQSREGSHTLRRSGARALFDVLCDGGYDGALRVVQMMLGHATTSQTETYIGLELDRAKRDRMLKGRWMFPALHDGNVVPFKAKEA